jgi:hypothetical protein
VTVPAATVTAPANGECVNAASMSVRAAVDSVALRPLTVVMPLLVVGAFAPVVLRSRMSSCVDLTVVFPLAEVTSSSATRAGLVPRRSRRFFSVTDASPCVRVTPAPAWSSVPCSAGFVVPALYAVNVPPVIGSRTCEVVPTGTSEAVPTPCEWTPARFR